MKLCTLFTFVSLKISCFFSLSQLFFVPLQCRRTSYIYVSNHKILWSHGARDTLLSEHQTDVSLAETEGPFARRSRPVTSRPTEAPHVSSVRSKHYLPIARPALIARFPAISGLLSFLSPKSHFPLTKVGFSLAQTSAFLNPLKWSIISHFDM